jgi:hypothetical protein
LRLEPDEMLDGKAHGHVGAAQQELALEQRPVQRSTTESLQALERWHVMAVVRCETVTGPGGKRILLEDSAGNPVELFEPA